MLLKECSRQLPKNQTLDEKIKNAVDFVISKGISININGAWVEYKDKNIISVDPLIAVLIKNNKFKLIDPVNPGFINLIKSELNVDAFWIYRFHMGFDRQYQIMVSVKDKE